MISERKNLFSHIWFISANTGLTNTSQAHNSNYASSEDEQQKYRRVDSTASYTSEDEQNSQHNRSYVSQQSENESISYYNPESFDEQQQQSYYNPETVKRSYSYTSDEAEETSFKRQKLRWVDFSSFLPRSFFNFYIETCIFQWINRITISERQRTKYKQLRTIAIINRWKW